MADAAENVFAQASTVLAHFKQVADVNTGGKAATNIPSSITNTHTLFEDENDLIDFDTSSEKILSKEDLYALPIDDDISVRNYTINSIIKEAETTGHFLSTVGDIINIDVDTTR